MTLKRKARTHDRKQMNKTKKTLRAKIPEMTKNEKNNETQFHDEQHPNTYTKHIPFTGEQL